MSHPDSQVQTVNGIRVKARKFRTNLLVHKSIGGKVEVRSQRKRPAGLVSI